jgi:ubiquitin carboxyl-terminal hydrolase 34
MDVNSSDEGAKPNTQTETPSSSSSAPHDVGSPDIELILVNEDESEYGNRSPQVAVIDVEDDLNLEDELQRFPHKEDTDSLPSTVKNIIRYFEYESVENENTFCLLRDWIDSLLNISSPYESLWYDNYINNREFWDLLPDIVSSLSRRKNFFGLFLQRSKDGRRALSEFLCQFARLTARFVTVDVKTLSRRSDLGESGEEPVIASRLYMSAFGHLLRKEQEPHIGRNLEQYYRWNWNEDSGMLLNTFLTNGGSIPTLTKLTQGLLALVSRFPKLIDNLTDPCRIVYRAIAEASVILREPEGAYRGFVENWERMIAQGYQFYRVMAAGLIPIIEKHVTFLSADAASAHIMNLAYILSQSLASEDCPARKVLEDHRLKHPSLPLGYSASVISNEWKFEILKKLICSSQMQLRMIGVTTMCGDLLHMFTRIRKNDDPATNPMLLHFAKIILENKLIDYIVGIGSHPEIIVESYNIVGFVVATRTYTVKQTDMIWRTVLTSQDPRVVEAILRMLTQILNLYDYESLLYLCKKVDELPFEAFTVSMRDYCEQLLRYLVSTAAKEKVSSIDAPPYELCVRLIREASISQEGAPMGSVDVQYFASTRLRDLMVHGPEAEVRNNIYVSCIEDISDRTRTAPGSICALFELLRQNMATDLHVLTTNHGLTRLMVEELEVTNTSEQSSMVSSSTNSPARQARRELLLAIINYEAPTITEELGARLWDSLVGRAARRSSNREIGWQILNSAAKKSQSNTFVATCFKDHLPKLDPDCYTVGSLDFARQSIVAQLSEVQGDFLDEEQLSALTGVEQLWRMILTAPPNSVEAPAVNILVELYVDSEMVLSMSRLRAHTVHLSIVNRCLDQLSSAAAKLKRFNDGSASGEEDSMVVVASEDQIVEQELIFTRSLMLLREFLRSYQSKPRYMVSKPRSPILPLTNEVVGEVFNIKYQVFDGGKSGDIKELSIGKQNTVATLFATVQKAEALKGCKMFHWGKKIDLDEIDLVAGLDDLKIGRGLLLVVRNDDEDTLQGCLRKRSSTIELEIIKHFDELFDFLGMEERLAKEVSRHHHIQTPKLIIDADLLFLDQVPCLQQALNFIRR